MKKEHNFFIDPKTKAKLSLRVDRDKKGEIFSGALYNKANEYPIIRGIPRFVDNSLYAADNKTSTKEMQTAASFGRKWREGRSRSIGTHLYDAVSLGEQLLALLGCSTKAQLNRLFSQAKNTLNAGCGVAWSEYLFNNNPQTQRHCVDISLSVETAYKNTLGFENVSVAQASVFELPYPDNFFDIIYSIGVIHHTPDPRKAFFSLLKKLAPGGLIGIYIYNHCCPIIT